MAELHRPDSRSGLEFQATKGERRGRAMRRRRALRCWALVALGALLIWLGAFGFIRIALVWNLVQSLAR